MAPSRASSFCPEKPMPGLGLRAVRDVVAIPEPHVRGWQAVVHFHRFEATHGKARQSMAKHGKACCRADEWDRPGGEPVERRISFTAVSPKA